MKLFMTSKQIEKMKRKARVGGFQDAFAKFEDADKIYFGHQVIHDCTLKNSKLALLGDGHMIYHNVITHTDNEPGIHLL